MLNKTIITLSKDNFSEVLKLLDAPKIVDIDFLYDVYSLATESIKELQKSNLFNDLSNINIVEIIKYCIGEYLYSIAIRNQEEIIKFNSNDDIKTRMAAIVADKYISLDKLGYQEKKLTNRYFPLISSLDLYLSFMHKMVDKINKNNEKNSLIADLFIKSVSISSCCLELLLGGFETQAFSAWRTLHESECILLLFAQYGESLMSTYLKHMKYGIIYRQGPSDNEENNAIFETMKEEMKELNLKSKDIKKYIEYGWLYSIDGVKEDPSFKLNFRDGLQKLAGQSHKFKHYEMSSEIIHSTPLLIYSNKQYFFYLTLISLYESFFNLEKVFNLLFKKTVDESTFSQYLHMKDVYYQQLLSIYAREVQNFKNLANRK